MLINENNRKKKRAVVAGHVCLDITPVFPENPLSINKNFLLPGSLVQMNGVDIHTGGVVANTGLAMKKFGIGVSLIAKIGQDEFGGLVAKIFKDFGQNQDLIYDSTSSTSYSIVLAMPGVDRMFLHNPGANNHFVVEDISDEILKEASVFHFGYPPLMKSVYEKDGEELLKIFQKVKKAGLATSLDLAGIDSTSEAAEADWQCILEKTLPYVDFFMPSIEELCFMIDRERYESWQIRAEGTDIINILDIERDVKPLAEKCILMGARIVVIKCGALGLYYKCSPGSALYRLEHILPINRLDWGSNEGFEPSYIPERVLSGTGAGDTCIAAFLSAILKGYSFMDCIHLAAAAGATCVTSYDALSGLLPLEQLKDKIDKGWKKNEGGLKDASKSE